MKHSALCLTLLLVVVFLSSVLITPAWAPPNEKPEKLTIGTIGYHPPAQAFYVYLTAQFGIAQAGDHVDFMIATTLVVTWNGNTITLTDEMPLLRAVTPTIPEPGAPVPLALVSIDWDRIGGTVTGNVAVDVTTQIVNKVGNTIGPPAIASATVDVGTGQ
jgi:hypothetical protein